VAHVSSGSLRRLADDARAVPDADVSHLASCRRCALRRDRVAADAETARSLLAGLNDPSGVAAADLDAAWSRLAAASREPDRRPSPAVVHVPPRSWRLLRLATPQPALVGAAALVLVVGVATAVLADVAGQGPAAPQTTAAGGTVPQGFQEVADLVGVNPQGRGGIVGGFDTSSGSLTLPFGVLRWSSAGAARSVPSLADAERATGLQVRGPSRPPAGVGSVGSVLVQPAVTATVDFGPGAGAGVAGSSLTVTAGPAVLVAYRGTLAGMNVPALVTMVMAHPTATATLSPAARLETFLLSRPDLPAGLRQELRLLGNLTGVVAGAGGNGPQVSEVTVAGAPGVLVTDGSGVASGVIWEDSGGTVHAVAGLLDQHDVIDVADQVG
jgi:hypothetical protein